MDKAQVQPGDTVAVFGCGPVGLMAHEVCIDAVGLEAKTNIFEKAANVINLQAGSSKIVEQAIHATRRGGRISILGIYATNYDNFPLAAWIDKGFHWWHLNCYLTNLCQDFLKT